MWGAGPSDVTRCYLSYDGGDTLYNPSPPQVDQTSPACTISAVIPLPDGNCLIAASDVQSITTPSTKNFLYKTNDVQKQGRSMTQVATLPAGGYISGFSYDVKNPACLLVSCYGYKQDSSTTSPNQKRTLRLLLSGRGRRGTRRSTSADGTTSTSTRPTRLRTDRSGCPPVTSAP